MKYLVTGAAGFIGSHLTDALLARGHEVVGLDNLLYRAGSFPRQTRVDRAVSRLIRGDLLDGFSFAARSKGVDAVYHLAANADIRGSLATPRTDLQQNTVATFEVLEAMRLAGITRIVFASSAAALGEPEIFPTPENCPIPAQTSLYGASKMAGEGLVSAYCEGYGFEGYSFRFVSLLGPRYPHGHVFDFVKQLLADPSRLRILGDGTQRKSYLHVEDCVGALMQICDDAPRRDSESPRYEVYHLGVPAFCLVRDSARWICEEMRVAPQLQFGTGNRGWIGDSPFVFLDVRKAMSAGWAPTYSIEASVRQTVRWLVANRWIFTRRQ